MSESLENETLPTIPYETVRVDKSGKILPVSEDIIESTHQPCCASSFIKTDKGDEDDSSRTSSENSQTTATSCGLPHTFLKISHDDLDFHECCGEGSFGSVFRCTWKSQRKEVAVKKLHQIDKEAHVLSALSHRNVIQFYGACAESPNYHIVTEYAPYGSLYAFLSTPASRGLNFVQMLSWARDIALGMNYLHNEAPVRIVHRDLKSKNVVICQDMTLKLCDFGASRFLAETVVMTVTGTYPWMAPEMIQGLPTSESCDVYSFGIVLWELLTREVPFKGLQGFQVAWCVAEKRERPPIPTGCPTRFSELIRSCWHQDPYERPQFPNVLTDLGNMIDDEELGEETDVFLTAKPEWVDEVQEKMKVLQQQERDLESKEEELKAREEKLKEWERELKNQFKNQSFIGKLKYNKKSENLSCKFSSSGEGAVDSIKDVLSHIMSKSELGGNLGKQNNSSRLSKIHSGLSPLSIPKPPLGAVNEKSLTRMTPSPGSVNGFGNGKLNTSLQSLATKGSPLRESPSPLSRMRPGRRSFSGGPTIYSDINFDKNEVNKSMDLFGPGRRVSSAATSPCDFVGMSTPMSAGDRPTSASGGRYGKLQKQVSTSSEEFQFEGQKVSMSTQHGEGNGSNFKMSEPNVSTWETASGGAKVNRTNEKFEYDAPHPDMDMGFKSNPIPMRGAPRATPSYRGPSERDIETALKSLSDPKYKNVNNSGFAGALSKILEEMDTKKQAEYSVEEPEQTEDDAMKAKLPTALNCRLLSKHRENQSGASSNHRTESKSITSHQHSNKLIKRKSSESFSNLVSSNRTKIKTSPGPVLPLDTIDSVESETSSPIKPQLISQETQTTDPRRRHVKIQTRARKLANAHVQTEETRLGITDAENGKLLDRPLRQREILKHFYNKYYDEITKDDADVPKQNGKKNGPKPHKPKYVEQNHLRELLNSENNSHECSDSETDGYLDVAAPSPVKETSENPIEKNKTVVIKPNYNQQRPASANDYMRVISPPATPISRKSNDAKPTHATYPFTHDEEKRHRQKEAKNLVRVGSSVYKNEFREKSGNALTARQLLTGKVKVPVINEVPRRKGSPRPARPTTIKVHHVPENKKKHLTKIKSNDELNLEKKQKSKNVSIARAQSLTNEDRVCKLPGGVNAVELGGPNSGIYETDDYTYIIRANHKRKMK